MLEGAQAPAVVTGECTSLPPPGTGNVNIEEAEKLLKPYLNRYPKVRATAAGNPLPNRTKWTHTDPHEYHCRAPSSCSLLGGLKLSKEILML